MGGFIFVAAVVLVVVMLGFRITPAVVEYFAVKQALAEALNSAKDPTAMPDIQKAFQRRIDAGYIESVTAKDVELRKDGNTVVASVAWSRTTSSFSSAMSRIVGPSQRVCSSPTDVSTWTLDGITFVAS